MCWYAHGEPFVPHEIMVERMIGSTYSAINVHGVKTDNEAFCGDIRVEWRPQKEGVIVLRQPRSTFCGMFIQPFFFHKLLFSWIIFDAFSFYFHETYNSQLKERYGDDPLTHLDFYPDLWMETGSFGGSDRNQVYRLSNTTVENLRTTPSVSTVGSSQSVSSTQSQEFVALQQHTTISPKNMSNSRRIMNNSTK